MDELLDTAPLRDQRTMVFPGEFGIHADADAVCEAWRKAVEGFEKPHPSLPVTVRVQPMGLAVRKRRGDHSTDLHRSKKILPVYVSGGRWIADCPECNGGVPGWPLHRHGCCLDCGTIYRLDYPTRDEIAQIVELLQVRPEQNRNYEPHKGDTLASLATENTVYQFAAPARVTLDVGDLRDVLSAKAFRDLEEKGLIPKSGGQR